jgi:D-lactate dehydrogenase (cytochrome)
VIRAQRPADAEPPPVVEDPAILQAYLEDASGAPPGRARGLVRPASEQEAAAFLRTAHERGLTLLPQAARSSLTGGAIPQGECVVSLERMTSSGPVVRESGGARQTIGPGVRLRDLQERLATEGLYYPPVPTYQEAMLGGTVSTNAGGAATFKYGVTRQWVRGLRVLLHNGDLLVLERGEAVVRRGESFSISLSDGDELRVPTPEHRLPALKKISAGYYSSDPLDLIDLFVGSEGTLGLITGITIGLIPKPPAVVTGLVFPSDTGGALRLTRALREAAMAARSRGDGLGPDVRAIEWLDGNGVEILRRSGEDRRLRVQIPDGACHALLFEMEIDRPTDDARAEQIVADYLDRRVGIPDHPLLRLCEILDREGALDTLDLAFPEDARRQAALGELREALPRRVSEILAERRRGGEDLHKVGGDLIVPFDRLPEMVDLYVEGFRRRGLEHAIWGHVGDGNLHPNALAGNAEEVRLGFDALLEFGDEAARRGGCPLSEHGVGRHPVKQELLRRFLGAEALDRMRAVKSALDPRGILAPGVLFPPAA